MTPSINLYNEDCLPAMRKMADNQYDLAIVDPPYGEGNDFAYKGEDKFTKFDNTKPNKNYFDELFRVSKEQIIWGGNYFAHLLPETNAWIVWNKNNGESKMSDGEVAWTSLDFLLKIFKCHWTGSASLWEDTNGKIHITQKPVQLYKYILHNYAEESDKILDTHGGSMSIAIACHDYGFDLDLYEIDKEYFEAGKKRLETHKKRPQGFFKEKELQHDKKNTKPLL